SLKKAGYWRAGRMSSSALADAGETRARGPVIRVEPQRLIIGTARIVHLAALLVDQRLIGPALRKIAVQLDRLVEIGEGILVIANRQIGDAPAIIGLGRTQR